MAHHAQPEFPRNLPGSFSDAPEWQAQHDRLSQNQMPTNGTSRASSSAASDALPNQQPLKNAIGNAFERSDTARVVDLDLIAQITAEVKKSVLDEIKSSGIAGPPLQQPIPVDPMHIPLSPASTSASIPTRDVYTPPSPKYVDTHDQTPADPLHYDPLLDGNNETPTPRCEKGPPMAAPRERSSARPSTAARLPTDDYTPIERMWQRLFDPDGQPLPRLGEFLRGLALHLIEDYEPQKTLVVTPAKMLKFYEEVKVHDEIYPWQAIFGKLSYSSLGRIYRDMRCQHHLIQEHPAEQPYIPALTPEGFQEWMTVMIQAYPEAEYERLARAVLTMPISNADDRKERFPKELPRRLFPATENLQAQQLCAATLSSEGVGPLRKAPTFPPPPPQTQFTRAASAVPIVERDRNPYVSRSDSKALDADDDIMATSVPIERQRQPYTAAPGGGRNYDDDAYRGGYPEGAGEHRRRTQSITGQWAPPPHETYHHHHQHHGRTGSIANTRRPRSPSFSNYGTQSDTGVRDMPASYHGSSAHDFDDGGRYSKDADGRRHDRHRRSMTGTDSSFDSQSRSAYDDDDYRRGSTNGYEARRH